MSNTKKIPNTSVESENATNEELTTLSLRQLQFPNASRSENATNEGSALSLRQFPNASLQREYTTNTESALSLRQFPASMSENATNAGRSTLSLRQFPNSSLQREYTTNTESALSLRQFPNTSMSENATNAGRSALSLRQFPNSSGQKSAASEESTLSLRQILAASLGSVVEWYDFALYGFFTDPIAKNFFENVPEEQRVLWTQVIFAGAFVMRPIGGAICGYIGDTYGRGHALRFTIMLMGVSTLILGSIPPSSTIGGAAIALLIIARFMQGMGVGGELVGAVVYTMENSSAGSKLFAGALIMATANLGNWLGAAVSAIWHECFTTKQLEDWAWRIPFLTSGVVAFAGWWFRRDMNSGEEFSQAKANDGNPLTEVFKTEKLGMLKIAGMLMSYACAFYVVWIWSVEWVDSLAPKGHQIKDAYVWNLIGMTLFLIATPAFGYVLGKFEHLNVSWALAVSAALTAVIAPLFFMLVETHTTGLAYITMLLCFSLPLAVYCSVLAIYMYNQIPNSRLRYTAFGVAYNFAFAAFGGTAPAVSTLLLHDFGALGPGLYITAVCAVSVCTLVLIKDSPGWELDESDIECGAPVLEWETSTTVEVQKIDLR